MDAFQDRRAEGLDPQLGRSQAGPHQALHLGLGEVALQFVAEAQAQPGLLQQGEQGVEVAVVEDIVGRRERGGLRADPPGSGVPRSLCRGSLLRKANALPFRPQNLHWCFWPHQQPRLVSKKKSGSICGRNGLAFRRAKKKLVEIGIGQGVQLTAGQTASSSNDSRPTASSIIPNPQSLSPSPGDTRPTIVAFRSAKEALLSVAKGDNGRYPGPPRPGAGSPARPPRSAPQPCGKGQVGLAQKNVVDQWETAAPAQSPSAWHAPRRKGS